MNAGAFLHFEHVGKYEYHLLKRMTEYADAGISLLRVEYENNGTLRLDNYIE